MVNERRVTEVFHDRDQDPVEPGPAEAQDAAQDSEFMRYEPGATVTQHLPPNPHIASLEAYYKMEIWASVIEYSGKAKVVQPPVPVASAAPYSLKAKSYTNEVAGLILADELQEKHCPDARMTVILLTDGEPNEGSYRDEYDAEAASLLKAREMKQRGVHFVTIGFRGDTYNPQHLKELASRPDWFYESSVKELSQVLSRSVRASLPVGATQRQQHIAFVIDASTSMGESGKAKAVNAAYAACIQMLQEY